jgi:uncharacterized DUF497 family protein
MDEIFKHCTGFDWDEGNRDKNGIKHRVSQFEQEEVFFNQPLILREDVKHSHQEKRYFGLGQTNEGRKLFIAFTIRENLIRVISARDMSKKEREIYEQA